MSPSFLSPDVEPAISSAGREKQIVECVENRLRHNSYLTHKEVRCDCHEGVLTLRGHLPTYYLKQLAESVAACVDGVEQIRNEIEIMPSTRR